MPCHLYLCEMQMKTPTKLFCIVGLMVFLSACGGSYNLQQAGTVKSPIRTVALTPQDGNSAEVDAYMVNALTAVGLEVRQPLKAGEKISSNIDAVVSYTDLWRWDLVTYMAGLQINLYDARNGTILATGRWRDSGFHSFHRGEGVTKELIRQIFSRLNSERLEGIKLDRKMVEETEISR